MRNLLMTIALAVITIAASAQTKGDWYVGTGDVANVAWTEWSLAPTVDTFGKDTLLTLLQTVYLRITCL